MSYADVAEMASNEQLQQRLLACAALENRPSPELWVRQNKWALVARSDWESAWASAVLAGVQNPGRDAGVITDQMILSSVQELSAR